MNRAIKITAGILITLILAITIGLLARTRKGPRKAIAAAKK